MQRFLSPDSCSFFAAPLLLAIKTRNSRKKAVHFIVKATTITFVYFGYFSAVHDWK
jgi:hypothetical protein